MLIPANLERDLQKALSNLKEMYKAVAGEPFTTLLAARLKCCKTIMDSWNKPTEQPDSSSAAVQSPLIDAISEIESILASGSITDLQQKTIKEKLEQIKAWAETQSQKMAIHDGAMRRTPADRAVLRSLKAAFAQPIPLVQLGNFQQPQLKK